MSDLNKLLLCDENTYSKVLFVTSAAFNRTTGGGITFSNLFRGWPKDRLATVHNDPVATTDDVCAYYYVLEKELRTWPVHRSIPATTVPEDNGTPHRRNPVRDTLYAMKRFIFGNALPEKAYLSKELAAWIADFRPQLLYSILGGNGMMDLVETIRRRFALPLVLHMMDDWPALLYRGGLFSPWQRRGMQRRLQHLCDRAHLRMGISDEMCSAYAQRYGQPFVSFQNAVDCTRFARYARKSADLNGGTTRLLYIGSIFEKAQLQSLIDCCRAVSALRKQGRDIRLDIFSPRIYSERFRQQLVLDACINLYDSITDDDKFFNELGKADILILPVNFDAETVRFIRYSMPTKVPAYLLSGTPILVYGPAKVAQVSYALRERWGHVVNECGIEALIEGIQRLIDDPVLRQTVSSNARHIVAKNHDAAFVRERFQRSLCLSEASQ